MQHLTYNLRQQIFAGFYPSQVNLQQLKKLLQWAKIEKYGPREEAINFSLKLLVRISFNKKTDNLSYVCVSLTDTDGTFH